MKKTIFNIILLTFVAVTAQAQWLRVWHGDKRSRFHISETTTIPFSIAGSTLTVGPDSCYSTAEIDSITIVNPVTISWTEEGAAVDIPESVEGVTATINGGNVVITNKNLYTEQEFILQGSSSNGSFLYNGDFKAKFHLNGLDLTSTKGSVIDIECGKRIDLFLEDGKSNTLMDAPNGSHKSAFYCKGHLEVSGSGTLTVSGLTNHAIATKEYLFLKKTVGQIMVAKAVGDGIHCGEYFKMNGGVVTIEDTGGDGLQVETDLYSEEELNGQFIMNGGSISVTVSAMDTKGIRLDDDGTLTPVITPKMFIYDGNVNVNIVKNAINTKGIASDGDLTIGATGTSPNITVNVDADADDEEEECTGIKAKQALYVASGTTNVAANGELSRGVRAYELHATGGTLTVTNVTNHSIGIKLNKTFMPEGGIVKGKFTIVK